MLNKCDVGFSRKCPWAIDLENMATAGTRHKEEFGGSSVTFYLSTRSAKPMSMKG
jgi:hypothetical protein